MQLRDNGLMDTTLCKKMFKLTLLLVEKSSVFGPIFTIRTLYVDVDTFSNGTESFHFH